MNTEVSNLELELFHEVLSTRYSSYLEGILQKLSLIGEYGSVSAFEVWKVQTFKRWLEYEDDTPTVQILRLRLRAIELLISILSHKV